MKRGSSSIDPYSWLLTARGLCRVRAPLRAGISPEPRRDRSSLLPASTYICASPCRFRCPIDSFDSFHVCYARSICCVALVRWTLRPKKRRRFREPGASRCSLKITHWKCLHSQTRTQTRSHSSYSISELISLLHARGSQLKASVLAYTFKYIYCILCITYIFENNKLNTRILLYICTVYYIRTFIQLVYYIVYLCLLIYESSFERIMQCAAGGA